VVVKRRTRCACGGFEFLCIGRAWKRGGGEGESYLARMEADDSGARCFVRRAGRRAMADFCAGPAWSPKQATNAMAHIYRPRPYGQASSFLFLCSFFFLGSAQREKNFLNAFFL